MGLISHIGILILCKAIMAGKLLANVVKSQLTREIKNVARDAATEAGIKIAVQAVKSTSDQLRKSDKIKEVLRNPIASAAADQAKIEASRPSRARTGSKSASKSTSKSKSESESKCVCTCPDHQYLIQNGNGSGSGFDSLDSDLDLDSDSDLDLDSLTVKELRQLARTLNIPGRSTLKTREQLLSAIRLESS